MLVGMLYSGPYYIMALYGLVVPGCEWMPDLTLVHSGALAQVGTIHHNVQTHNASAKCPECNVKKRYLNFRHHSSQG